jgi:hypothetical protein
MRSEHLPDDVEGREGYAEIEDAEPATRGRSAVVRGRSARMSGYSE